MDRAKDAYEADVETMKEHECEYKNEFTEGEEEEEEMARDESAARLMEIELGKILNEEEEVLSCENVMKMAVVTAKGNSPYTGENVQYGGVLKDVGNGGETSWQDIRLQQPKYIDYKWDGSWMEGVEYALPRPPKKPGGLKLKEVLGIIWLLLETRQVLDGSQPRKLD